MNKQISPTVEFAILQLQWILDNASGGGDWRRKIIERIAHLNNL